MEGCLQYHLLLRQHIHCGDVQALGDKEHKGACGKQEQEKSALEMLGMTEVLLVGESHCGGPCTQEVRETFSLKK